MKLPPISPSNLYGNYGREDHILSRDEIAYVRLRSNHLVA